MKEFLTLGMIQPVINPDISWNRTPPFSLNINPIIAERVWEEIKTGLIEMLRVDGKPHIILIPELHLPVARINTIKSLSKRHNVIIISGIDFQQNPIDKTRIRNRGIICFPDQVDTGSPSIKLTSMQFGKTYFTYMERSMFKKEIANIGKCSSDPEQNMYIFQSQDLGNFGIMICSDIFDIERMAFYQGQIHHLFIISLNKDLNTYFAMAESLTRLLYCNVTICNTGYYGGTVSISPYSDPNERTIYKYIGQRMFNSHVINIPLKSLNTAQEFDFIRDDKENIKFKASPPSYPKIKSNNNA